MRETLSRLVILLSVGYCPFLMGQTSGQISADPPPDFSFAIARVFPHDTSAYTQGLAYRDGFLYEGTGRNGQSSLRKVRLETGEVIQRVDLGSEFFGEGIAIVKDTVFQLTWKSGVGFVYDLNDFHLLRKVEYSGEGWGLARISPRTGDVVGWIDLTGLLSPIYRLEPEALFKRHRVRLNSKAPFCHRKTVAKRLPDQVVPETSKIVGAKSPKTLTVSTVDGPEVNSSAAYSDMPQR